MCKLAVDYALIKTDWIQNQQTLYMLYRAIHVGCLLTLQPSSFTFLICMRYLFCSMPFGIQLATRPLTSGSPSQAYRHVQPSCQRYEKRLDFLWKTKRA